ncbi:hypothetical protein C7S18_15470 [Ahniella affigens]|uniref:Imelysin-like domain-containing protein n=1 Tax=Ahniella affigens TaxID=2021234 RepID=A0A2P1PUI1_9GAMM|nr:hypothetical protein [Ahniella affigens]AVP98498.1 hypothetical protein C7S18_15470 [Ahniella affigens]
MYGFRITLFAILTLPALACGTVPVTQPAACEKLAPFREHVDDYEDLFAWSLMGCLDSSIELAEQLVQRESKRVAVLQACSTGKEPCDEALTADDDPAELADDLADDLTDLTSLLAAMKVKQAMLREQPVLALKSLNDLPPDEDLVASNDPSQCTQEPAEDDGDAAINRCALEAILHGQQSERAEPPINAPQQPWIEARRLRACGTGAYLFAAYQASYPTNADAWIAVGEPEVALSELLRTEWTDFAQALLLPFQLRSVAARAYGPAHANTRFQSALNTIEVVSNPLHRSARINLFGTWLPLPVGEVVESLQRQQDSLVGVPGEPHFYSKLEIRQQLETAWQQQDPDWMIDQFIKDVSDELEAETAEE